ncbi:MAG TPA: hypothetical protein VFE05_18100 [Longimicrobiaceae bacterium]|jgi:bacteriocin-like protein|nr:hypothetical protein [Longimicrobiaceae bacterium]
MAHDFQDLTNDEMDSIIGGGDIATTVIEGAKTVGTNLARLGQAMVDLLTK